MIEPKKRKVAKTLSIGFEFDPDVKTDKDYCQKIYKNHMYFHEDESVIRTDLEVIKFLVRKKEKKKAKKQKSLKLIINITPREE